MNGRFSNRSKIIAGAIALFIVFSIFSPSSANMLLSFIGISFEGAVTATPEVRVTSDTNLVSPSPVGVTSDTNWSNSANKPTISPSTLVTPTSVTNAQQTTLSPPAVVSSPVSSRVNINTAQEKELMTLWGIGEVKSQAIIDYRATYGPFESKEEIKKVKGIGDAIFNKIKDQITI